MVENQFIDVTYINSGRELFEIGKNDVEKLVINSAKIIIHFNDDNRKYRREIPLSSILYFDTNYRSKPAKIHS